VFLLVSNTLDRLSKGCGHREKEGCRGGSIPVEECVDMRRKKESTDREGKRREVKRKLPYEEDYASPSTGLSKASVSGGQCEV
jgi:hypothetical protein